jgi:hypothetical protein
MTRKKKVGFSFLFFCFLSLTRWTAAQNSSIAGTVTDRQWFQFMAVNAFDLPGLDIKMPLLVGELNLNAREQQEIESLFSNHGDEDVLSEMTVPVAGDSPGESAALSQEANTGYDTTQNGGDDDPVRIMIQVKRVRKLLGDRDLDFRFWFYEENLIDSGEDNAYRENQNYSEDELAGKLLATIERTQEFRDFKNRKILYFHSGDKVENYMTDWEELFESRVLLQIHQVMHRG